MKKNYKIILGLILSLGFLIRVSGIADNNTGFYVDEASLGFNARSILETGSDEYGQELPLAFRSFGDFKSPLFIYVSMPLVGLTGEVIGVRLTSAILGALTVLLVAGIARKIAGEKAGLVAGAALAILPWHVNLSRHGVEAVLATTLLAGAILLISYKKYRQALVVLALSTFAYHSTKYVSPLLALLIATKVKFGKEKIKWLIAGIVWFMALFIIVQPFANVRALGVKQALSIRNMLAAYLAYFSPRMLILGDWQARNGVYGASNVWLWVTGFFYVGIWQAVKRLKENGKSFSFLFVLATLILAPFPAAATIDPFHSIRALIMVIPLTILAGIGGDRILSPSSHLRGVILGVVVLIGFQVFLLSERLLVQNKLVSYDNWGGGYQQLVEGVLKLNKDYSKIVVDTTDASAVYSLWQVFGKVPTKNKIPLPLETGYYKPIKWQGPKSLVLGNGLKIYFKPVYWPDDQKAPNTLYVGSVWRFDKDALLRAGAETMVEIKDPSGKVVWMAVATKN